MTRPMTFPALERVQWWALRAWHELGYLEITLLALLLLWGGLEWQVNRPLAASLQDKQLQLAELQELARKHAGAGAVPPPINEVQRFQSHFPKAATREKQLIRLHEAAKAAGLVVDRIDYREEALKELPLKKLALRLSTAGSYEVQRKFLHELLEQNRNLSLDRISIERSKDSTVYLQVLYEASLYFQGEP